MRIRDAVVVITGASSGIGRASALAFADEGAAVVLAARREQALAQVAQECATRGARVLAVPTDVSDPTAVDLLARTAVRRFGRIDVWVNNAAVTAFGRFDRTPLADVRRVLDVNVMGYVHGARAALPVLRAQGRGVLVNVGSIVGMVAQPYTHAYIMAKFAIRGLSGSLRQELRLGGHSGVHVSTVLPASIDTPLFGHAANYTGRRILAMSPVYAPERVARTILGVARRPRREVVSPPMGRALVALANILPGIAERLVGRQVDRTHLSRTEPAADTPGNLFSPAAGTGAVPGGWRGSRRPIIRRPTATAALGAAGLVATGVIAARRCRTPTSSPW